MVMGWLSLHCFEKLVNKVGGSFEVDKANWAATTYLFLFIIASLEYIYLLAPS